MVGTGYGAVNYSAPLLRHPTPLPSSLPHLFFRLPAPRAGWNTRPLPRLTGERTSSRTSSFVSPHLDAGRNPRTIPRLTGERTSSRTPSVVSPHPDAGPVSTVARAGGRVTLNTPYVTPSHSHVTLSHSCVTLSHSHVTLSFFTCHPERSRRVSVGGHRRHGLAAGSSYRRKVVIPHILLPLPAPFLRCGARLPAPRCGAVSTVGCGLCRHRRPNSCRT